VSSISIIGTGHMTRVLGAVAVESGNAVEVIGRGPAKAARLAGALGRGATARTIGTALFTDSPYLGPPNP
jgi:8-hydroxy-5-deazaflavin:NADPH oxidoreductase